MVVARAPPARGVHGRRAGVGEQVEEAPPARQLADQARAAPVVEEQAGVEVVGEVDEEAAGRPRATSRNAPSLVELLVLLAPALAPAHLEEHVLAGGSSSTSGTSGQDVREPRRGRAPGRRSSGGAYSCTCAAALVEVDGDGVLGQVGVVDAVAA